jgi:hypothetical protein
MKTPHTDTLTVSECPRALLWIIAAIAMAVTACSSPPPPPQQSTPSASTEQTPPPAQLPASIPQDDARAPSGSQLAQVPPSNVAPQSASEPRLDKPVPKPGPAPAPAKPRIARLKAGQMLTIRTTRALSTKTMNSGDVFSAILEEPIRVDDWVVVPAGARVEGRIVEADDGGRLKGKANISIELTSLTTSGGQKVEIVTTPVGSEAVAKHGKDAAKVGVGAGAGAAVGAVAGGGKGAAVGALIGGGAGAAMRGEAAEIPAESVVSFELRSPVTIQERK